MKRIYLIALVALAVGCAGELENPERFAACPPGQVEQIFVNSCAGSGCHGAENPGADLDLVSPDVEARLIGEPSSTEFCEGRLRIDPMATDPMDHLLLDKLQATPSCGGRMPFGTETLSAAEQECMRRWVDDLLGAGGDS
jgi:hypothetical protein